jgi:hypothetical protein
MMTLQKTGESKMARKLASFLMGLGIILLAFSTASEARTFTISWDPVTGYTDNTPISGVAVSYAVYWTADPGLSPASLKPVAVSLSTTSTAFDPELLGMTVGQSIYFAAKAVLATGLESSLSPAYSWTVPPLVGSPPPAPPPPPPVAPTLARLSIGGPASVAGGGSGSYFATAVMSDNTTRTVTPAWSVSPAGYASIDVAGLFTATQVVSAQTVTVNASYTTGGVTRTASLPVAVTPVVRRLPATPSISGPTPK